MSEPAYSIVALFYFIFIFLLPSDYASSDFDNDDQFMSTEKKYILDVYDNRLHFLGF